MIKNENFGFNTGLDVSTTDAIGSIISKGFAIIEAPVMLQAKIWSALDGMDSVSKETKNDFSFPGVTEGFLPQGGERAKYTESFDLCDRFCYWYKNRPLHQGKSFTRGELYKSIEQCEDSMHSLAKNLVDGIWQFFSGEDRIRMRENSYLQLCIYVNEYRSAERDYLQDPHEDGHLITLIKPDREGLVIFPNGPNHPEVLVHLRDNELIVIAGSLLTALSGGRIPPMYHAVRNPRMSMKRKSMVYFAIPDLSPAYTTLLARKKINIAEMADESHQEFGNVSLI